MFYQVLDIMGTIAFAISGVLVAMDKRLDVFGVLIIAFVTVATIESLTLSLSQ